MRGRRSAPSDGSANKYRAVLHRNVSGRISDCLPKNLFVVTLTFCCRHSLQAFRLRSEGIFAGYASYPRTFEIGVNKKDACREGIG
jgi:hypothetical protein